MKKKALIAFLCSKLDQADERFQEEGVKHYAFFLSEEERRRFNITRASLDVAWLSPDTWAAFSRSDPMWKVFLLSKQDHLEAMDEL